MSQPPPPIETTAPKVSTHRGAGDTMTFTLSGLVPNGGYDLYIYAGRNQTDSASFTVGALTLTTTFSGVPSSFLEGTIYVRFANLAATGSGNLVFTSSQGVTNGFTLVPASVPEPPAYGAAVAGLLMLVAFVRRHRGTA